MSRLAEETSGPAAPAAGRPAGSGAVRRRRLGAVLQGVGLVLGLGLLVGGFGLIALDYTPYNVPTPSMSPTIAPGDTVLARDLDGASIGRGDIVVFHDSSWGNETLVKRVVAIGGDTVVCCDAQHRLTVNGTPVDEPYLADGGRPSTSSTSPSASTVATAFTAKVPDGRLFLLGDNRAGSLDSRVHLEDFAGTVPAADVIGRVEATVWPWAHTGLSGRTVAFDALGGLPPSRPGPLVPAAWATVAGAVLIVLISLTGPVAALAGRLRGRGRA